jgi:hypothetical protein
VAERGATDRLDDRVELLAGRLQRGDDPVGAQLAQAARALGQPQRLTAVSEKACTRTSAS